jgi:hypothetical protein
MFKKNGFLSMNVFCLLDMAYICMYVFRALNSNVYVHPNYRQLKWRQNDWKCWLHLTPPESVLQGLNIGKINNYMYIFVSTIRISTFWRSVIWDVAKKVQTCTDVTLSLTEEQCHDLLTCQRCSKFLKARDHRSPTCYGTYLFYCQIAFLRSKNTIIGKFVKALER